MGIPHSPPIKTLSVAPPCHCTTTAGLLPQEKETKGKGREREQGRMKKATRVRFTCFALFYFGIFV